MPFVEESKAGFEPDLERPEGPSPLTGLDDEKLGAFVGTGPERLRSLVRLGGDLFLRAFVNAKPD